jgi:Putative bacterial sensory transduction regulator
MFGFGNQRFRRVGFFFILFLCATAVGQVSTSPAQPSFPPANQRLVTKITLDAMDDFIRARGYRITRDSKDNFFYFTGEGHKILVYVLTETTVEFAVIFTGQVDLKDLNEFNGTNRTGAAFVSKEGNILLDETLVLDGGVTEVNLEAYLFNFAEAASRFYTFLNDHSQKK